MGIEDSYGLGLGLATQAAYSTIPLSVAQRALRAKRRRAKARKHKKQKARA